MYTIPTTILQKPDLELFMVHILPHKLQGCIRQEVDALYKDWAMVRRALQDMLLHCQLCVGRGGHTEGVGP